MKSSFVEFKNISKIYHLGGTEIKALSNVSYSFNTGDFVIIAGPSGSGKSTFLNILGCIDKPTAGQLFFEKEDITQTPLENLNDLRLKKFGFIFQSFNLVPVLTAYENVELPLLFTTNNKREIKQRVEYVLEKVGLSNRMKHFPANLSGGQRQRVAIARALVCNPSLIIADEPTASLDQKTAASVIDLLTDLNKEEKTTIILASHDQNIIERARVKLQMQDGVIVNKKILSNPTLN